MYVFMICYVMLCMRVCVYVCMYACYVMVWYGMVRYGMYVCMHVM